jgi:hypothetical protein
MRKSVGILSNQSSVVTNNLEEPFNEFHPQELKTNHCQRKYIIPILVVSHLLSFLCGYFINDSIHSNDSLDGSL